MNRAGVPLLEIVTQPDIESASEALMYIRELQRILRAIGVFTSSMGRGG
jgi:aspartyl-tRNA(Asn)/glutamyl-tRNA(Gln) amidotransferase subunit B